MVKDTRASKGPGGVRPLGLPRPIEVRADQRGWPVAVRLGRRWVPVTVEDRWRVDEEWWREEPVSRGYYRLVLEEGRTIAVYCDVLSASWYC